jgi:hypothetical protein
MNTMTTRSAARPADTRAADNPAPEHGTPQQLRLTERPELPAQFRLDQRTRLRGLAHVAEIRAVLAAQSAQHATAQPTQAA